MLRLNKALWLGENSHRTQSGLFQHSYATLKYIQDIGSWFSVYRPSGNVLLQTYEWLDRI